MTQQELERLIAICEKTGYKIFRNPGEINIIYLEGLTMGYSLEKNADQLDGWNDVRMLVDFIQDTPRLLFWQVATTEPGAAATVSEAARKRGGVARIAFGQYLECWVMGVHKKMHEALVQVGPIKVHRDVDRNGIRTGDPIDYATGINQHTTSPNFRGPNVGRWSEGCLVGRSYKLHLRFIALLKTDPRYISKKRKFRFSSIILPADILFSE
ncbi:hypothetical protein EKK58_12600 [Candidatus Dependentiae bacterium]|nr:MAG: hypothetical protein EKK58_12600 [Candidatus Dependentiae bacterium]